MFVYESSGGKSGLSFCISSYQWRHPPFTPLSGRSYSDGRHMTWISSSNLSFLAKRSWQCTEKTAMCGLSVTWQGAFIVSFLSPDRGRLYFCFVLFFLLRNDVSNGPIIRGIQLKKFVNFFLDICLLNRVIILRSKNLIFHRARILGLSACVKSTLFFPFRNVSECF